jgi:hypothetical protein
LPAGVGVSCLMISAWRHRWPPSSDTSTRMILRPPPARTARTGHTLGHSCPASEAKHSKHHFVPVLTATHASHNHLLHFALHCWLLLGFQPLSSNSANRLSAAVHREHREQAGI